MIDQSFAHRAIADQKLAETFRRIAKAGDGALENTLHGKRRQRGLFRRLPDDGVAANDG